MRVGSRMDRIDIKRLCDITCTYYLATALFRAVRQRDIISSIILAKRIISLPYHYPFFFFLRNETNKNSTPSKFKLHTCKKPDSQYLVQKFARDERRWKNRITRYITKLGEEDKIDDFIHAAKKQVYHARATFLLNGRGSCFTRE